MGNELNIKILTIDDDASIRRAIAAFLDDQGFTVLQAENGRIGLERFRNENPDLVLIDLRMPEMNGIEVLSAITRESPETPIIVVSGVGVIQEAIEAIRAGAWDFITKPIQDMSLLEHIVTKVWNHALILKQNREYRENLEKKTEELEKSLKTLRNTQDKLVAQEKLASLGTLTAGIAHEIKNPLNFVINFAEECTSLVGELQEEIQKQAECKNNTVIAETIQMLESSTLKIVKHGQRADNIVQSMLLHSSSKRGEWQYSDINMLLEEYTKLAYHSARAKDLNFNVNIQTDLDASLQEMKIVPQDLCRAFLNILNNAFYAINEKIQNSEKFSPIIKTQTKDFEEQVDIRIWDNGCGIPKAHIPRLFEPFFTTKPAGIGTGLGLSLCFDIVVKEHQGTIDVKSEEGKFTEILICLPKQNEDFPSS